MDLQVAASGGGYGHTECPQGIPVEFALLSILAAFGVAFGVLFMALTQQTMGRRRRRSTDDEEEGEGGVVGDLAFKFGDVLWAGELANRDIFSYARSSTPHPRQSLGGSVSRSFELA